MSPSGGLSSPYQSHGQHAPCAPPPGSTLSNSLSLGCPCTQAPPYSSKPPGRAGVCVRLASKVPSEACQGLALTLPPSLSSNVTSTRSLSLPLSSSMTRAHHPLLLYVKQQPPPAPSPFPSLQKSRLSSTPGAAMSPGAAKGLTQRQPCKRLYGMNQRSKSSRVLEKVQDLGTEG